MVVSTLKAARKRTGKIRSNLHTGQYDLGKVSPTFPAAIFCNGCDVRAYNYKTSKRREMS